MIMVLPHIVFRISIGRSALPRKILSAIPYSAQEGKDN